MWHFDTCVSTLEELIHNNMENQLKYILSVVCASTAEELFFTTRINT